MPTNYQGVQADPAYQREYAKDVMVGNVPLDTDDEGFDSIGLELATEDIHQFFLAAVNEYETELAAAINKVDDVRDDQPIHTSLLTYPH